MHDPRGLAAVPHSAGRQLRAVRHPIRRVPVGRRQRSCVENALGRIHRRRAPSGDEQTLPLAKQRREERGQLRSLLPS